MIKSRIKRINFMEERVTGLRLADTHIHTHTFKSTSQDKFPLLRIFHKGRNSESPDPSKIILKYFLLGPKMRKGSWFHHNKGWDQYVCFILFLWTDNWHLEVSSRVLSMFGDINIMKTPSFTMQQTVIWEAWVAAWNILKHEQTAWTKVELTFWVWDGTVVGV